MDDTAKKRVLLPPPHQLQERKIRTILADEPEGRRIVGYSLVLEYEPEEPGGPIRQYTVRMTLDQFERLAQRMLQHLPSD